MSTVSDAVLAQSRLWIGTPYHHAASLRGVGCDCLGLIRGVWRALYGAEPEASPPYAPDWAEAGGLETLRDAARRHLIELPPEDAQPGDVFLFRWRADLPAKHLGIISGPGMMIHAHDGACVVEVPMGIWQSRIAFAFRFPDQDPETP